MSSEYTGEERRESSVLVRPFPVLADILSPRFLAVDLMGLACLFAGTYWTTEAFPLAPFAISIGSTLLTVGLTLPIVMHLQDKQNRKSFQLLNACKEAGIEAIVPSRDSAPFRFARAVEEAASAPTGRIRMLTVAASKLLRPVHLRGNNFGRKIYDPGVDLSVLVLNPASEAAIKRQNIEGGERVTRDVENTIHELLPSIAQQRLKSLINTRQLDRNTLIDQELDAIVSKMRMTVGVYSHDPICALLIFDSTLMVEQYHFGRPPSLPSADCIGGFTPVMQLHPNAQSFPFLCAHFDYVHSTCADITKQVVRKAIENETGPAAVIVSSGGSSSGEPVPSKA